MASDEIVWQVINQQFCAFKLKTTKGQNFCRNEYNVSGLCNRQSCPLANSRYATIRSENGISYLYMKTAERAHLPSKLWERIKLSEDYTRALTQLDERLIYWPKFLVHKCKQRLTRLTQVAMRARRLAAEEKRLGEELVGVKPKIKRKETTRERKALAAAKVEKQIEKELIDRLRSGAYGETPLNVSEGIWKKVLKGLRDEGEMEEELDAEDEEEGEIEDEEDEEEEGVGEIEYVSGDEDLEEEMENEGGLGELEDWMGSSGSSSDEASKEEDSSDEEPTTSGKRKREASTSKPRKRSARVEIEYENESEKLPGVKALAF